MSPRTEEQFEVIRQEKRQLIMETALELFAARGFENTTINQIAKEAKISKGLLYNYFTSKEELLEALLNKGIDDMLAVFDPNNDGVLDHMEMDFFITQTFRMIRENRKMWKLYIAISFQPSVYKTIEKRSKELYEPMVNIMSNYFKDHKFDNPQVETFIFSALMDGVAMDYIMAPDIYPLDAVVDELKNRYCKQK
jgi:AcrR family transcriptional regulator